jgi:hypothetical protein
MTSTSGSIALGERHREPFGMNELDRRRKRMDPPNLDTWNRQMQAVRVFEELMSNTYRDTAPPLYLNTVWDNLLITTDWNIWLTDRTGAFRTRGQLQDPDSLVRCPRIVLGRLRAMNKDALRQALGKYLTSQQLDALDVRRSAPREAFRSANWEKGEADARYDLVPRR